VRSSPAGNAAEGEARSSTTEDEGAGTVAQDRRVTGPDTTAAPTWSIPRGLIVILAMTGLLVSTLALQQFAAILAPVLLALVLVIAIAPLTGVITRWGAPRWVAVTVTLLGVFGVIVGLAAALAVSLTQLATLLPGYEPRFEALVVDLQNGLGSVGVGPGEIRTALSEISLGTVAGLVGGLLSGFASTLSNLIFLLFVAMFMVLDSAHFTRRMAEATDGREGFVAALGGFVHGTRSYLLVSTVFGLIVAVLDGLFLLLVGVPLPLLWALLAFVTNYIPNIGFVLGVVPPALLALLEGGPQLMLTVVVAYSVINFVIQSIIQPKYVGDAVNLSLTLTFLSLIFWSFIIGPLGAVLAIPLTLLAKALLLDMDPATRWISTLFASGATTPTGPPAPAVEQVDQVEQPGTADPVVGERDPG